MNGFIGFVGLRVKGVKRMKEGEGRMGKEMELGVDSLIIRRWSPKGGGKYDERR